MEPDEFIRWAEEMERQHQQWWEAMKKELDRECPPPSDLTA